MFDVAWSELVVIAVIALIVIGPKELPGVLRAIGHWMGKIRRMAAEFQGQFQEAMREAEVADLKKSVDDLSTTASNLTDFNPMAEAQKEIDSVVDSANKALSEPQVQTPLEITSSDAASSAEPAPSASPDHAAGDAPADLPGDAPKKQAGSGA